VIEPAVALFSLDHGHRKRPAVNLRAHLASGFARRQRGIIIP
jgi:hypothetical protein